MRFCCAILFCALFFQNFSSLVFAENLYPVGGSLSNKNNEIVEFLNISCGNPNVKNEVVGCRKTYVEIKPSIEKLLSLEELAAIAKRDSLDVETFLAICEEMEPIFAYTDGKSVGGRTITPDERKEIESQTAAMGYDIDIISSMKTFCKSPSNHRIVQLMNQMQIAESKICKVESYTLAEMEYKLDPISGKFIRSEVVSGICDQYNLTEILTLDQFGLGTISLLERKMTFIQQRAKGDDRKAFNCDAPDEYEDKIYSSERTYSPLKCESFIGQ